MGYVGTQPVDKVSKIRTVGTLSANQSTINIEGGFVPGNISVYIGGFYIPPADYDDSDGFNLVFSKTLDAGTDYVVIEERAFEVANHYTKQEAETTFAPITRSRKNYIINGCFRMWQRGTNFSLGSIFTADRWKISSNSGSASRQEFTLGQTDVPGEPTYYLRYTETNGTGSPSIQYKVEEVRTLAGQTATYSFYARASKPMTLPLSFVQKFGSGGSTDVSVSGGNIDVTGSWQKFTVTVNLPSIAGKTLGPDNHLYITLGFSGQGTFTSFDLAQVQLEKGSIATDFEYRDVTEERILAMRYYQRGPQEMYGRANSAGDGIVVTTPLPVYMRKPPTVTLLNGSIFAECPYFEVNVTRSGITISGVHSFVTAVGVSLIGYSGLPGGVGSMVDGTDLAFDAEIQ